VFLDRDGVINQHKEDYVKNISEFYILPNVGKQLSKLCKAGFELIVITNQSAINRGLLDEKELHKIHEKMISELKKDECFITAVYFCPHTPEESCNCRKPNTGLFEDAIKDSGPINIADSWMIGDDEKDLKAGSKIGLRTFRVTRNQSIRDVVEFILNNQN